MKKTHRFSLVIVLLLVLTTGTFAGQIDTPGVVSPTPSPTPSTALMTAGEITIDETSSTSASDISNGTLLTDVASNLLQLMLSVF